MTAKLDKLRVQPPLSTLADLNDSRLQVVIRVATCHAAEKFKRMNMAVEKTLHLLRGIRPNKRCAGICQPHAE